jgi:hypothetical protein
MNSGGDRADMTDWAVLLCSSLSPRPTKCFGFDLEIWYKKHNDEEKSICTDLLHNGPFDSTLPSDGSAGTALLI